MNLKRFYVLHTRLANLAWLHHPSEKVKDKLQLGVHYKNYLLDAPLCEKIVTFCLVIGWVIISKYPVRNIRYLFSSDFGELEILGDQIFFWSLTKCAHNALYYIREQKSRTFSAE